MAQTSLPQGGSGVGDAGPYSSDQWAEYLQIAYTGDQQATQGVLIRYLNELAVTNPIAVTIRIATGAGFVNGHLLINNTNSDINVNLCGVVGQTRWNRVVMVENNTNVLYSPGNLLFPAAYVAGIVRNTAKLAILQGSCGTPGGLPALVQNANYWYTELARFQVTSASPGAITDYRDYCEFSTEVVTEMIEDLAVTGPKIGLGAVDTPQIAVGAVTTTEILNNTIVAGDVANETLTPTQILNRTRRFFVCAYNGYNVTDDEQTFVNFMPPGLYWPDSKYFTVTATFIVPDDYASGLNVEAVVVPWAAGNLRAFSSYGYGQCGEAWDTNIGGLDWQTVAVTHREYNCIMAETMPGSTVGDIVTCHFRRDGLAISDTINAAVYFLGWIVEYTADS